MSTPANESNVPRPGSTPTVLLVGNEPTARAETARLLRTGLKWHVWETEGARQAVALFRQHGARIELVLTDFLMPVMDGGELAERIRDLNPRVPIVLISPALTGDAAELLAAYQDLPRLTKPFTFVDLARAVLPFLSGGQRQPWRRTTGPWRFSSRNGVER